MNSALHVIGMCSVKLLFDVTHAHEPIHMLCRELVHAWMLSFRHSLLATVPFIRAPRFPRICTRREYVLLKYTVSYFEFIVPVF